MAAKKKAVLFLAACLLGLAAYLYHAFCQQDNQEELVLQGNVDVREVSLAFRQSDRILEMLAEEGDRVQTSTLSDKTATVAMNYKKVLDRENDEWFAFLWNRYHFLKEELDFVEHSVEQLEGSLSGIIKDLLNKELTWDYIAGKYHVSTSMISKYKKTALKELNACYELRYRQAEAFMLS